MPPRAPCLEGGVSLRATGLLPAGCRWICVLAARRACLSIVLRRSDRGVPDRNAPRPGLRIRGRAAGRIDRRAGRSRRTTARRRAPTAGEAAARTRSGRQGTRACRLREPGPVRLHRRRRVTPAGTDRRPQRRPRPRQLRRRQRPRRPRQPRRRQRQLPRPTAAAQPSRPPTSGALVRPGCPRMGPARRPPGAAPRPGPGANGPGTRPSAERPRDAPSPRRSGSSGRPRQGNRRPGARAPAVRRGFRRNSDGDGPGPGTGSPGRRRRRRTDRRPADRRCARSPPDDTRCAVASTEVTIDP